MIGVSMEKPWRRVFRGLVSNNPMLYNLNRIMYDEKTSEFIDKFRNMKVIGIYKHVSRELNLEPIQFKRLLYKLMDYKLEFFVNIFYPRINLISYLLFIENKYVEYNELHPTIRSWLRSYTKTFIPKGTFITIYTPYSYKDIIVKRINEWLDSLGASRISSLTIVHRFQPSFTKYDPSVHPLYKGYEINELEDLFNKASEDKPSWFISENELEMHISNPNDIVDLLLLKELEADAFTNIDSISKKYGIRMKTLRKHLIQHLIKSNVINGIYLKLGAFVQAFGSPILLLLKISSRSLYYKWINFFSSLENNLIIDYSPYSNENVLYIVLSRTYRYTENIKSFLISKATAGFIEELIPIEYIVGTTVRYTIPYKNFDQESKNWSIDLDSAHRKIERRVFKK